MDRKAATARIKELSEELELHNHRYYVEATPTISDHEFDMKLKELEALEQEWPDLASQKFPVTSVSKAPLPRLVGVHGGGRPRSACSHFEVEGCCCWL